VSALLIYRPEEGGKKNLRNGGKLLPDYTAQYSRRQPPSYPPPCVFKTPLNMIQIHGRNDNKGLPEILLVPITSRTLYSFIIVMLNFP
jgi:hypothetical protein